MKNTGANAQLIVSTNSIFPAFTFTCSDHQHYYYNIRSPLFTSSIMLCPNLSPYFPAHTHNMKSLIYYCSKSQQSHLHIFKYNIIKRTHKKLSVHLDRLYSLGSAHSFNNIWTVPTLIWETGLDARFSLLRVEGERGLEELGACGRGAILAPGEICMLASWAAYSCCKKREETSKTDRLLTSRASS